MRSQRAFLFGLIMVIGLMASAAPRACAQSADVVKAAFVIGFADLVSWPSAPQSYTIGIEGSSAVGDALQRLAPMIKNKKLVVKPVSTDNLNSCQIVYISSRAAISPQPGVLTVGEGEDFVANGGIIGFVIRDGKVRFLINKEAAQRAGIKISPRLFSMAAA